MQGAAVVRRCVNGNFFGTALLHCGSEPAREGVGTFSLFIA